MSSKRSSSIMEGTMRSISGPGRCTSTASSLPISDVTFSFIGESRLESDAKRELYRSRSVRSTAGAASPPAGEEVNHRDEERRAEYRPEDRERVPVHPHPQHHRECERV